MVKTVLSPVDQYDLRASLQISTLEALMRSRRWEPGELIFQGGTSLSLVHGSPRFSEDLDFLIDEDLKLDELHKVIQQRLESVALRLHPQLDRLTVSKNRDDTNPQNLVISVSGANLIGSVKVKVQMWRASTHAMHHTKAVVSPIWTKNAAQARTSTVMVPTATPGEIYADKIKAIVDRPHIKGRDVFDLYWLTEQQTPAGYSLPDDEMLKSALRTRIETYPGLVPEEWLDKAKERMNNLAQTETIQKVKIELQKWLPSYWPLDDTTLDVMIACAKQCIQRGQNTMLSILADADDSHHVRPRVR